MDRNINEKLMKIYNMMYERLGPQHWWPAETQFEVAVGAILTQFVSWANVAAAIARLKEKDLLSVEGICRVPDEELEELIRSTRFYRQKARKLKTFCEYLRDRYDSSIEKFLNLDAAALRKELLSLYGIGEETADSIILYSAGKPVFVVDAYTRRIFHRLGFFYADVKYGEMQAFFMEHLEENVPLYNEYHALIVALGNEFCRDSKPKCEKCPVNSLCNFQGSK